ncbi:MAG TPA: hypothetical protein PKL30_24380 [Leptospiraceae bacterium]|nr:hypothetical protein [Leptospiraceae bacterium]HMZ66537.1 hypothetical protein [Leptospiraceae bacterium]HNA10435.1 hypothetical protein [Leptospiraceae bacterium]HNB98541.1 hypothetical protein [Leptospiraceae bacterium]HNC59582.1 hypothetical protein [Leptospiraceae bacterium]
MNHNTLLEKLPSSIYTKESSSNNAKLWKLYAEQANSIEDALLPIYDLNNLSGINLDKFALILGIEREGRSDNDYRNALLNFQNTEIDTASLPALYTAIAKVCPLFTITELCYPREYETRILDGNGFMDGLQNLDPSILRPKIIFRLDGSGVLDGSDCMEPCFIRPASILITILRGQTDNSFLDYSIFEEDIDTVSLFTVSYTASNVAEILSVARSILLPGIAIYIKEG